MNASDPSQILLALISPVTAVALIVFVQNWQARRAAKPREHADTNATNLEAQGKTVDRLTKENERLGNRLEAAEKKIEDLISRDEKREADLRCAESKIDELEAREEARDKLWRAHTSWDDEVELIVRRMGHVQLSQRPPLELPQYPTPDQ